MIEIFKQFTFEAAHQLASNVDPEHPYATVHGHSFTVEVYFVGEKNPKTEWVEDFAKIEANLKPIRDTLDHKYLNKIEGLEKPTLENIAGWIFEKVEADIPSIDRVLIRRGSCGEGCVFRK